MNAENEVIADDAVVELLPPTEHQQESIDFLVDAVLSKKDVVGFIAPGGCGKTFSLKHFARDTRLVDESVTFTATTNKAVTVMRKEGIPKAKTLHSAISKHIPTPMFATITAMFKQEKEEGGFIGDFPQNVSDFLKEINVKDDDLLSYKNEKELLAENKVDGYDNRVFSHYATAEYIGGTVSIDESSMLPTKSQYNNEGKMKAIGLDAVMKVYDTVILVGDDSQIPPINGTSSFDAIEKTTLTENHRSDKGLLRILDYARQGGNLANFVPEDNENVRIVPSVGSEYFDRGSIIQNNVTHIVYRNKTRKEITHRVRHDLTPEPTEFEPIVYKGATIDEPEQGNFCSKNETGFFNGMMGEWDSHSQAVSGRNFDEYGEGFTYLSYGYAITCHTAQGSSFDYVVIHIDDIPHFIDKETRRKWIYTAVSRAKKGIVIVY